MQSLTGQYECAHRSALGLDYFTARLDRLTLYPDGHFTLITQEKSRLMHAAKNLASGQQASMDAPEAQGEGSYSAQGNQLVLIFSTGEQERATIQDAGLQFDKDFFEKVSDTTFMPPAQRLKSNMDDIAKGLKIAGTIGGTVLKAAKTIQDTLQTAPPVQQPNNAPAAPPAQGQAPGWSGQPSALPQAAQSSRQAQPATQATGGAGTYCDQCGAPVRAGKNFCNTCGARLV